MTDIEAPVTEIAWRRLSIRMLAVHPVREVLRAWPVLIGLLFFGRARRVDGGLWGLVALVVVVLLGLARWYTTTYRVTPEQETAIAVRFKDALTWVLDDWEAILADVIELEMER